MLANQAIVRFLEQRGATHLFHLPGVHTLPLNSALENSQISVLMARHEANMAFMADGFARASGEAGVVLVTPGPGLGNIVTACMEAHADDVPMVFIVIEAERKRADKGVLHGMKAPEALLAGIAKAVFVVSEAKDVIGSLDAAFRAATSGRKGPVAVFIPYPFLEKEVPYPPSGGVARAEKAASFDPGPLEKIVRGSSKPVIVGGGGLLDKGINKLLDGLCGKSSIPFLASARGKGAVREDRTYAFGSVMGRGTARRILNASDLVIAVGTRLREVDTKRRGVKLPHLVHIDVDDRWIGRNYRPEASMTGDMKSAVESLAAIMKGRKSSWDMEALAAARAKEEAALEKESEGFRIVRRIRGSIPGRDGDRLGPHAHLLLGRVPLPRLPSPHVHKPEGHLHDLLWVPGRSRRLPRKTRRPVPLRHRGREFHRPGRGACHHPGPNLPVVILVYNNGEYGLLEGYMRKRHGIEKQMMLANPDLIRLAGSFGIKAKAASSLDELAAVFRRDIKWDEPYLIDFRYPEIAPPWD